MIAQDGQYMRIEGEVDRRIARARIAVKKLPQHCREHPLWRSPMAEHGFELVRHPAGNGTAPVPYKDVHLRA